MMYDMISQTFNKIIYKHSTRNFSISLKTTSYKFNTDNTIIIQFVSTHVFEYMQFFRLN